MDTQTVTVAQARGIIGIGNTSIYAALADGRLTRVRIGRRTLVTVESINRLIADGIAAGQSGDR